jgi:hypothetical protein
MNLPLVMSHLLARDAMYLDRTLYMQKEHNLVLPDGRNVPRQTPKGVVSSMFDPQENYLVRVVGRGEYETSDIIVEYNTPNIINLKSSGLFSEHVIGKIVYGPSIPFDYSNSRDRGIDVLTNFINTAEPRRAALMEKLVARFAGYRNVQGIYDLPGLELLYSNVKILVNPHQTWHHHSIEEFRVLPALSRGCIVISEDVPLREHIPYHNYVLWCPYEEIPGTIDNVLGNYDRFFERIHGHGGLPALLESMKSQFQASMDSALARFSC